MAGWATTVAAEDGATTAGGCGPDMLGDCPLARWENAIDENANAAMQPIRRAVMGTILVTG